MQPNSSLFPGITNSTTSNLRRNLFSNSTSHAPNPSTSYAHPSQPPAAPRRPTSRPTSRTATRNPPSQPNISAEHPRPYSRGYARPQSRAIRPRSRGFGFDGADERDVSMYDDGDSAGMGQDRQQEEEEQEVEEIIDDRILIEEDEIVEVEGLPKMGKGEVDQMLAMVMRGLEEAEDEGEEDGDAGGDEGHVDGDGNRIKITTEMIEMYRAGKGRLADEAEFKQAVTASLRQKVASLDDDKWMYEEEEAGNGSS